MNKNYKKIWTIFGLVFILIALSNPLITTYHAEAGPTPGGKHQHFVPDLMPYLQPGDIIFMDPCIQCSGIGSEFIQNIPVAGINSNDHCALFVGTRVGFTENDWCIHAGSPVHYTRLYGPYDPQAWNNPFTTKHVNFSIFRVATATQGQRNGAIAWTVPRLGEAYQWPFAIPGNGDGPQKCENPNCLFHPLTSHKWYCSEFVWAAYKSQGIDIDYNWWGPLPWILPCVNMGAPTSPPNDWFLQFYPLLWYAFQNEIKLDDDMQQIYPPLP